ncbi:MAG TPA: 4'-phosphopantetheinyl transferase superfamily protein [Bryobacteraceae bacterium]|nr:4'-phosphopantetheinyl transferase superfamily protein [Bryobacteraceae bacterium]
MLSWHVAYELNGRIVHIWPLWIEGPDAVVERFRSLLAPDETDRAARFKFEHLRHSFILARGALRILLGRYVNTSPADLIFTYGSNGKPALAPPARVQFNASHSGGLALFAFAMDCEIGIDVEAVRAMPDMENIAKRFFCDEEAAELMSLPAEERDRGFYLCWTRKEAYIKATGEGLSAPLDAFRVTLRPGDPARVVHLAGDPTAARAWTLHDLALDKRYAAALAYRDAARPIETFSPANPKQLLDLL